MNGKTAIVLTALALATSLATSLPSPVRAAMVDTFDFQDVLFNSTLMLQATVAGSFSGIPDGSGFISLSSLQSFTVGGVDVTPNFFSFNVSGGASSADLAVMGAGDIDSACIGTAPEIMR